MKGLIKNFSQDYFCFWTLNFSLFFLTFGIIFLIFSWPNLPPQVPLFYSRPWGVEQLAPKFQLVFLPVFSFLIFIFNTTTAVKNFIKEPFLAHILMGVGTVLVFSLTVVLFRIINLIT